MTDETGRKLIDEIIPGQSLSLKEFEYGTLDDAIKTLERIRNAYKGQTLVFQVTQEPYSDHEYYQFYERRRETCQERDARLTADEQRRAASAARDRAEFDRLKALFPDEVVKP